MDKKKLTGDTKPAVIITAVDLPFNGNEFPKASAAFTTPIACKLHGINTSCTREILPLTIRYFCPGIYQITKKINVPLKGLLPWGIVRKVPEEEILT